MGVTTATALLLLLLSIIFSSSSSSQNSRTTVISISHTALTHTIPIKIGNPAQSLSVGFDTSSDVALLWCNTLRSSTLKTVNCKDNLCSLVPNSGCKSKLDRRCVFTMAYGDSTVYAELMHDRIILGTTDIIKNFTFGCVRSRNGNSFPRTQGFLGLGRGNLSLLYQSNSNYGSTFSYCLPSLNNKSSTGSLTLGQTPNIHKAAPLLKSSRRPSLYFVQLLNISVDGAPLPGLQKYFAFDSSTGAGTAIDSGIVFTSLVSPVYRALTSEVHRRMAGKHRVQVGNFDTCYSSNFTVTSITFKFKFMDLRLTKQQFVFKPDSNTECLAMRSAPNNVNHNLNIIGSYQQQNKRILISEPLKTLRIDSKCS